MTIKDNDLLEYELKYCKYLPWLPPILEELQSLRDDSDNHTSDDVEKLRHILDELGVEYTLDD